MIELMLDVGDKLRGEVAYQLSFWDVVSNQAVGVFDGGLLPGSVRLTRVHDEGFDLGQASELAALIGDEADQRQMLFAHTLSHPFLHGPSGAVFQPTDQGVSGTSANGHHQARAVALSSDDTVDLHAQRPRAIDELFGALFNAWALGHPTVGGALCAGDTLTLGVVASQAHARVALAVVPPQGLYQPVEAGAAGHTLWRAKRLGFAMQSPQSLGRRVLVEQTSFDALKDRISQREATRIANAITPLARAVSLRGTHAVAAPIG